MAQKLWDQKRNDRLSATSNVLAQLTAIKMSGSAPALTEFLQSLHDKETAASARERHARIALHALGRLMGRLC
jgi:hypothetical protein